MSKIPKLRFKEFSGGWESKRLDELGEFLKGSTLSKSHLSEEGRPCVLYGELYTKYGEVIKNVISKTNLDDSKLVYGKKNDVLIPSSGETAIDIATASCVQQDNIILGGDLNVFRSNEVNGIFTSYQLNNSKRNEIAKLAQGASVVHIYNNQLGKLTLDIPSKEEQEKIAYFFSLIDDKISLQGEKVEALKDYKKGMMQKIFSRELRFKDDEGRDYPEWEEKKLNELGDFFKGSTLSKSHLANDGKPCVLYGELYTKYGEVINNVVSRTDLEDDKLILGYSNDVLIPSSGETAIDIATASCLLKDYVILGGDLNIFRSSKINGVFLSYQLNNTKKNEISKLAQGASVVHLYNNQLAKLKVDIPCIDEQNKIADFLHNIDTKIAKEKEKLDSLNEYKKGLLQQMFI